MAWFRRLAIGISVAIIAWAVRQSRPAQLIDARVTAITPGSTTIAHLALIYGPGMRPISIIIDVTGADCTGSITLDGVTLYADIPLIGTANGPLRVATTITQQRYGIVSRQTQQFSG